MQGSDIRLAKFEIAKFENTSIPTPHAVAETTSTSTQIAFLTPALVMTVVSFLGNYAAWKTLDKVFK